MRWKPIDEYREHYVPLYNCHASLGIFDTWAADKGIVRYAAAISGLDWERILRTGRIAYREKEPDDPPDMDHACLFKGTDGVWLAYHAYLPTDKLRGSVQNWAKVRGSELSWYAPGNTCLVVITKEANS